MSQGGDQLDLWQDTMLIVNTDHGFLLGEHGMWNKQWPWLYDEIARMPLLIWDPRYGKGGERRKSLVQAIDWAPTLLDFFGVDIPPDMQGKALRKTIATDQSVREAGLFGCHGRTTQCTDGRYVYVRDIVPSDAPPLYVYTLMPTAMAKGFAPAQLRGMEVAEPFSFTKGCRLLKIPVRSKPVTRPPENILFDLEQDPKQEHPIQDQAVEKMMIRHMVRLMKENDAPPEQFVRLGLEDLS